MHLSTSLNAFLLLFSGIVCAFAAGIVWRRRSAPGAGYLFLFLLGSLVWSLTYALHWLTVTPAARGFWLDMTYLGVVTTPGAILGFALQFLGRSHLLAGRRAALLAVEPAITLLLLWSDPLHGLFYGGQRDPMQSQIFAGGPWFWVNVVYSYGLILASLLLLLVAVLRPNRLSRPQARIMLAGLLFPLLSNVIGFTGLNPFTGLDLTPIAFTFTGVFLAYGLFYLRLLDLVPIGRDVLVETMNEGMLLLDAQGRIVDLNPAAQWLLNLPESGLAGKPVGAALAHHPQIPALLEAGGPVKIQLALGANPPRYVHIQVMPVREATSRLSGTLLICQDISERVAAEKDLQEQLRQIAALQASLREQAIRDSLTGLFNRRYLEETLPRELASAARRKAPLSLVMLDIDGFKGLNDSYGHPAGDEVLRKLSQILTSHSRRGDIVCRYGGEEFLMVLSNTSTETARQRADQWRVYFQEHPAEYLGQRLPATLSAGVASFPIHGENPDELILAADRALYHAKAAGRDCVVIGEAENE